MRKHTLMAHVSSVSKSTIEFPPLASSALFGGRNRATTADHQPENAAIKHVDAPLIVLPAPLEAIRISKYPYFGLK